MLTKNRIISLFINHSRLCHVAERLILNAEIAVIEGNTEKLSQVAADLAPVSVDASRYYEALALSRSQGSRAQAEGILEQVALGAAALWRAKALFTLGSIHLDQSYYDNACKVNPDSVLIEFQILSMRAVLKSLSGDYRRALAEFERLRPMAGAVGRRLPFYAFNLSNDIAFCCLRLGDIDRAKGYADLALRSPIKRQEFQETFDEIADRRRRRNLWPGADLDRKTPLQIKIQQQKAFVVTELLDEPLDRMVTECYQIVRRYVPTTL